MNVIFRLAWTCDNRHDGSKHAALRFGFVYEALFHREVILKGEICDLLCYSMLDREWLVIKQAFEKWLDPINFDVNGIQRKRLADIRKKLEPSLSGWCFLTN